jgi:hypothetical protein
LGQWSGAGGAVCEDHLAFCGEFLGFARRTLGLKNPIFNSARAHAIRTDQFPRTPST